MLEVALDRFGGSPLKETERERGSAETSSSRTVNDIVMNDQHGGGVFPISEINVSKVKG